MAFPTFSPGDVLNASDMNAVGLWKIGGATFTTTTGFNLPNGSFSSTYRNYRLIIKITSVAADADFTGRMRNAGTNDTSSTYQTMFLGLDTTGNGRNQSGGGQTNFILGESDTTVRTTYFFDISDPNKAGFTVFSGSYTLVDKTATWVAGRVGTMIHQDATAYDSFAFISSQNISGEYWLYGYRDN